MDFMWICEVNFELWEKHIASWDCEIYFNTQKKTVDTLSTRSYDTIPQKTCLVEYQNKRNEWMQDWYFADLH